MEGLPYDMGIAEGSTKTNETNIPQFRSSSIRKFPSTIGIIYQRNEHSRALTNSTPQLIHVTHRPFWNTFLTSTSLVLVFDSNVWIQSNISLSCRGTSRARRGINHSALDLPGHCHKSLFNIGSVLSRCFQEGNSQTISKFLSSVVVYNLLGRQITLVANQQFVDTFAGISVNFLEPLLHVIERNLVRHIIHDNNTVSASVVTGCNSSESLLSCCVPNLQLYSLPIQFDGTNFLYVMSKVATSRRAYEVYTDGANVALCVSIVRKSEEKAGLSYTGVSNKQKFKKIIVLWIHVAHYSSSDKLITSLEIP